ncbi:MAG: MBL fold metallo-hydrolase [Oscillospiraceae bacterium]|nr:MBL fold metallo-hydrolase [Oscillospiraceae bacterium]
MELKQLTKHCWYSNSDPTSDCPSLGYILSDAGSSIMVDAGNSPKHHDEFMDLLKNLSLPLPRLCLITHWHWDHTLAICSVEVPVVACDKTQSHLIEMENWSQEDIKKFYISEEYAQAEYPSHELIHPKSADIVFHDHIEINLDGLRVICQFVEGPHSDDSTLIYIPEDGMIFAGDSSAGDFSKPNIAYDPFLLKKYTDTITSMEFSCFLHSHREPLNREETFLFRKRQF